MYPVINSIHSVRSQDRLFQSDVEKKFSNILSSILNEFFNYTKKPSIIVLRKTILYLLPDDDIDKFTTWILDYHQKSDDIHKYCDLFAFLFINIEYDCVPFENYNLLIDYYLELHKKVIHCIIPNRELIYNLMAQIFIKRGQLDLALKEIECSLKEIDSLLYPSPNKFHALGILGDIQYRMGKLKVALPNIEIYLKEDGNNIYFLSIHADILFRIKKKSALPDLNKLIILNPQDSRALSLRGNIFLKLGDLDRSESDLIKSLMFREDAFTYRSLAKLLFKKGDLSGASNNITSAMLIDNNSQHNWLILGRILLAQGIINIDQEAPCAKIMLGIVMKPSIKESFLFAAQIALEEKNLEQFYFSIDAYLFYNKDSVSAIRKIIPLFAALLQKGILPDKKIKDKYFHLFELYMHIKKWKKVNAVAHLIQTLKIIPLPIKYKDGLKTLKVELAKFKDGK